MPLDLSDESRYDRTRLRQWTRGRARSAGVDRRDLLKLFAAGAAAGSLGVAAGGAAAAATPAGTVAPVADPVPRTVKPLPPELFTLRGTNAETNFAALRGTGELTPIDRFFVRNHTSTPRIDADGWRLTVWGDGLTGGPLELSYALGCAPCGRWSGRCSSSARATAAASTPRSRASRSRAPPGPWARSASRAGAARGCRTCCAWRAWPAAPWTSCRAGWTRRWWRTG